MLQPLAEAGRSRLSDRAARATLNASRSTCAAKGRLSRQIDPHTPPGDPRRDQLDLGCRSTRAPSGLARTGLEQEVSSPARRRDSSRCTGAPVVRKELHYAARPAGSMRSAAPPPARGSCAGRRAPNSNCSIGIPELQLARSPGWATGVNAAQHAKNSLRRRPLRDRPDLAANFAFPRVMQLAVGQAADRSVQQLTPDIGAIAGRTRIEASNSEPFCDGEQIRGTRSGLPPARSPGDRMHRVGRPGQVGEALRFAPFAGLQRQRGRDGVDEVRALGPAWDCWSTSSNRMAAGIARRGNARTKR